MTATDTTQTDGAEDTGPRRLRPNQIAIIIGVAIALVVALSGVAATVFQFHDDSPIQREVFGNIPGPIKLAFYTLIPVMFIYGAVVFSWRVRNWERGGPDKRDINRGNAKRRMERLRAGLYMQTLLRDPAAGVMHSMIYFGFIVLLAVTSVLEINHQLPPALKFLHGGVYEAYAFVGDLAGLVFTAGVIWAIVRRYVQRPYRIRIKSKPEHAIILGTLLTIGLTGHLTEMFRIAHDGRPSFEKWSFIGYPLSGLVENWSNVAGWHQAMWILHILSFVAFLVILPTTMLRHIFTSPLNMYLRESERPKGAMKAMPNLMETEIESFGASVVEDFTWKQLLDSDACTMCGRCTSVCPAHATGKPLDPREIVLKSGEVMAASGTPVVTPPIGTDPEITIPANSLFDRITAEEVWSCTSCKACDEICPVNIEILDKVL
ncbi:MAG: (Fe-S)-binding protein, partial [Microthrixaceae bacterium]|nr:(Fe-S)-binding protein [Microthrixaceae bacterium]